MNFKKALISELKAAPYNPRKDLTDKDPEYQRIKRSIEEFGYVDPVIVNADYTVIGGHQRIKVLKDLGHAQIDVVVVDIPKVKEKALNIALNKITGEWDTQRLTDLLGELKTDGFDISITGFDEKEFAGLLRELHKDDEPLDSEPQISRAEELRKEWGTELGQMWQCGDHRVICGDCTDPAVVGRVMHGDKADMVFTDPPYNLSINYATYDDKKTTEEYRSFSLSWFKIAQTTTKKIVITCGKQNIGLWCGLQNPEDIAVWVAKNKMSGGKISNLSLWEPLLFYGKFDRTARASDVFEYNVKTQKDTADHPCPKTVPFVSDIIQSYSKTPAVVYDPFLGSGTTMIACENLGRKCRGIEIDPGYLGVILERYKTTFNKMPVLLESD